MFWFGKLDISITSEVVNQLNRLVTQVWRLPFGMSGEFVAENRYAVDCATGLEVDLNFFWCGAIVDLEWG